MLKWTYALCCAALLWSGTAQAQSWPVKPLKLIVSTPSGSTPDRAARILATLLAKHFGQSFLVENITGAGGLIATHTLVKAPPDGYTLMLAGISALVIDPHIRKDPGYDVDRDIVPIAMIYEQDRTGIAVNADVPARTLGELIALAKAKPGQLSYGVASSALPIMAGRWINKLAGTDMVGVAYKTQGQQMQDVLAGRTHWIITSPPQAEQFVRAGKLRFVAVDGFGRYAQMPDVQTISETFPGYRLSGIGVLSGPRGIPNAIVQLLNAAMDKVVRDPAYVQQLGAMSMTVNGAGSPEYIAAQIRERRDYWSTIFKALDVQPE